MDSNVFSHPDSPSSLFFSDTQQRTPSYQSSRPSFTSNLSPCASPTPQPLESAFSRQNRRLQLRNAGFRGGLLSTPRPISPQLAAWRTLSPRSDRDEDKENGGAEYAYHQRQEGDFSGSQRQTTSVLQEIENSTQRRKLHSPHPSVSTLFQKLQQDDSTDSEPLLCPPLDNRCSKTPLLEPFSPETAMGPKDHSSFVCRIPSVGSDEDRQKRQTVSVRTVSRGTTRYIEHLETQLAASLDRANCGDSPMAYNYASRYKALNTEHRLLKQELSEWEEQFEARVKEEMAAMIDQESQLRLKLRALERELETKDHKIRELEWETEMDHQRLRSLEAVNSTNRSLEKRVDVLTELLAQSPSKPEQDSNVTSGSEPIFSEDESIRRTPRPRSMFSRIPLSPVRRQVFQPLVVAESNAHVVDGDADRHGEVQELDISYAKTVGERPVSEVRSLDSGFGDSYSLPSTWPQVSQRSSMVSHLSSSSVLGSSLPLPLELPRRQRRMRRFPPGSSTLKPLILPSASALLSPSSPSHHSDSIDSSVVHSRTYSSNEWHNPSSFIQVHEDTLNALEGKTNQYQSFEEAIAGHTFSDITNDPCANGTFDDELEAHLYPDGHLHPPRFFETPTRDGHSMLEPLKQMSFREPTSDSRSPAATTVVVRSGSYRKKQHFLDRSHPGPETTLFRTRPFKFPEPVADCAAKSTLECSPSFRNIISGSITLAKRIFANSWHLNWRKIGKLPWWVFGLILGTKRRNEWFRHYAREEPESLPLSHSVGTNAPKHFDDTDDCTYATIRSPRRTQLSTQGLTMRANYGFSVPQRCEQFANPSQSRPFSLLNLWAKFSLAIALAIGLAIRDGPASLMCRCAVEEMCDNADFSFATRQESSAGQCYPETVDDIGGMPNDRETD
ncbi:hypothetical protein PRK78_004354 [Emydomyces testavorans]|uniref:Uncharacterized protein n=1 Tax=Emydomyces testavorans TaxID=2070801 RepID=A0AAF0IJP1_9EURO|nr:hypothetical protein PRK78_004354 [Emydomyces testavorans]